MTNRWGDVSGGKEAGAIGVLVHRGLRVLADWLSMLLLLDPYATAIDHLKDYPVVFDSWYHPRLDISRAGKPDWCGPINSHLAPCRCDCVPEFKRFDPIWQYPPRHPYDFPGWAFPGPSQYEDRANSQATAAPLMEDELPPKPLPPAPIPEP